MKSLRTKLILLIISSAVISAVVIGLIGVLKTETVIDSNSQSILELTCQQEKEFLDGNFNSVKSSVDSVVELAVSELESSDKVQESQEYRDEYNDIIRNFFDVLSENTSGSIAYYFRYNPYLVGSKEGFYYQRNNDSGEFEELENTDILQYKMSDTEVSWFFVPIKNGRATWMEPYYNEMADKYVISYVVPIYVDNTLFAVAGMDVDFDYVIDRLENLDIFDNGYAYILDEESKIVYHKDYDIGTVFSNSQNEMVEVSSSLQNGMLLVIAAKKQDIDSEKNTLITEILCAAFTISAIFVFLSILLSSKITKPLKKLNEAAQKIAKGDLDVKLVSKSKDEVGMLTDSFRKTVIHLREYMHYINGLAYRDSLTGLKNATAYRQAVELIEEKIKFSDAKFAVAVFDVNGLKPTNDKYGHSAGDKLIINSGKFICMIFAHSPVFRIGGDEFAVIMENGDYENRELLIEKFDREIVDQIIEVQGNEILVSVARGIAVYDESIDFEYAQVFKRADKAMYVNKNEGKKLINMELR